MRKLIEKPSYLVKLEKFKNGGLILKCLLGDVILKGIEYLFGPFIEAFNKSTAKSPLKTRLSKLQYTTALDVWNYITEKGISPRNAAAIMGNIMQESSFNRNAKLQGGDEAVGFFQMHGDDLKAYNDWRRKNRTSKYPEIDYVLYMIDSKDHPYTNEYRRVKKLPRTAQNKKYVQDIYGNRERTNTLYLIDNLNNVWNDNTTSLNDVTDLFTNTIERAGRPDYSKRLSYANDFYNHFYGN